MGGVSKTALEPKTTIWMNRMKSMCGLVLGGGQWICESVNGGRFIDKDVFS